jgi:glucose-1-phosphate thymidylyltransferase
MKKTKGILLAGGNATRLYPLTQGVSKHLLPIHDKPVVYYPLTTLMLAGIRDILIIVRPEDKIQYQRLLGDGTQWGINLSYCTQAQANGIAEALILAETFLNGSPAALILGDNVFFGQHLSFMLEEAVGQPGATVFACHVKDPQRYGIVECDHSGNAISIAEKPEQPKSNFAVTGLYFYDQQAIGFAKELKPSARGELEITDINHRYLRLNQLNVKRLGRGFTWFDIGTHETLTAASQFIQTFEARQNYKIACPEEVAWNMKFIDDKQLNILAQQYQHNDYGKYLLQLVQEESLCTP